MADEPKITAGTIGGFINPVYGVREPMTYPVMDHEFRMLSSYSTFAAVFFSVGSFLLSVFCGVVVNYAFASAPVTSLGKIVFGFSWVFLGISVSLFAIGAMFVRSRNSLEETIRRQTKTPTP